MKKIIVLIITFVVSLAVGYSKIERNTYSLLIKDEIIDQKLVDSLKSFDGIQFMTFQFCFFDKEVSEFSFLSKKLGDIRLISCSSDNWGNFFESLNNSPELYGLNFEFCDIQRFLYKLKPLQLTRLVINNCQLQEIPGNIFDIKSIYLLNLSDNYIIDIPIGIGNLRNLESLHLNNNLLRNLPSEISKCKSLDLLDLNNNQLNNSDSLFHVISDLNITDLSLKNNYLETIPKQIVQMNSLEYLSIERNNLKIIPDYIFDSRSLKYLNLSNNNIESIPNSIANSRNLETLSLSGNLITSINENLCNVKKLKSLNVRANPIITIPKCILEKLNSGKIEIFSISTDCFRTDAEKNKFNSLDNNRIFHFKNKYEYLKFRDNPTFQKEYHYYFDN